MEKAKTFLKQNGLFLIFIFLVLLYILTCDQYYIRTGSMEPTLQVGALAVVKKGSLPEVGDICAYQSGNNIVVHRVVDMTEDGEYITKGDNNPSTDAVPVKKEQIKGKVIFHLNVIAPITRRLLKL